MPLFLLMKPPILQGSATSDGMRRYQRTSWRAGKDGYNLQIPKWCQVSTECREVHIFVDASDCAMAAVACERIGPRRHENLHRRIQMQSGRVECSNDSEVEATSGSDWFTPWGYGKEGF